MPRQMCHVCGVFFVATRGDATTCSPRCRKIRSRFHQKHGRFPVKGECKEWGGLPHEKRLPHPAINTTTPAESNDEKFPQDYLDWLKAREELLRE